MNWTDQEIRFLREIYNERMPLEEISKKLNRSKKSIKRKAQNIGLHRERVPPNKIRSRQPQSVIDKRYYEKNKDKVYQRRMARRKRLKEEVVNILGGKCQICVYNQCISALCFHHHQDNKEGHVTTFIKNGSRQKVLKEANKCMLL